MQTNQFKMILCAAVLALQGAAVAGGEGWTDDYATAKKEAAESKKDLLMDFTGSDWCGWCIKLNDEVFKHDEFKAGVKDKFVLVELDYPQKKQLPEAIKKQNEELKGKYGIKGYPTIVLADAEGRPYAATGYQQGGPEKYVEHLNELRGRKTARDEAFATAEKAEGVAQAKAWMAALDAMSLDDAVVTAFYGDIAKKIVAADPKDETGYQKKAAAKQRLLDVQMKLRELSMKRDADGAMELIDKSLKEGGFDPEPTLQLMMTRAVIFAQQKKFDDALKAVDEAKKVAPKDSPMLPGIDGFRKRLEEEQKKAAEPAAEEKPADKPAAEKPADK